MLVSYCVTKLHDKPPPNSVVFAYFTNLQAGWAHWAALLPSGSGTECLVGGSAPRVLVLGPREGGAAAPQDEPLLQWPKRKVS